MSFSNLPGESCIPLPVLNMSNNCSYTGGQDRNVLLGYSSPWYLNICPTNTGTVSFTSQGNALRVSCHALPYVFCLVFSNLPLLCLPCLRLFYLTYLPLSCFALAYIPLFILLSMKAKHCKPSVGNCGQVKGEICKVRAVRQKQME